MRGSESERPVRRKETGTINRFRTRIGKNAQRLRHTRSTTRRDQARESGEEDDAEGQGKGEGGNYLDGR